MISLLVAMCTFRRQWAFFEKIKNIDDVLSKDFAVITPKKIFRTIALLLILFLNAVLFGVLVVNYYTYSTVLGIPSIGICISYYLANLPYFCVIMTFGFSVSAITRRFYYLNNILRQISANDIPKNVFELCSRTSKNDRHNPTIALNEIYSIYGGHFKKSLHMSPPNKSNQNQDEMKKEIKKLTKKLENHEGGFWEKIKRRNVIEIEEFKLSKMSDTDSVIDHLTKLLDTHDLLLDSINLQNEILSFQILLIVAQIFVFEVFALFSLYRTMYNTASESNVLAFGNFAWLIIYNLILYIIMSSASKCVTEGKLTGTYCHKVINKIAHFADPKIIEKVKI